MSTKMSERYRGASVSVMRSGLYFAGVSSLRASCLWISPRVDTAHRHYHKSLSLSLVSVFNTSVRASKIILRDTGLYLKSHTGSHSCQWIQKWSAYLQMASFKLLCVCVSLCALHFFCVGVNVFVRDRKLRKNKKTGEWKKKERKKSTVCGWHLRT